MHLSLVVKNAASRVFNVLAFALLICGVSPGQTFTSSMTGVITDPTGAIVANASVELRNMGTNDTRAFTSGNDGSYQFNNLQPGTYQITVSAPGFKTFVQSNLTLQAQISSRITDQQPDKCFA